MCGRNPPSLSSSFNYEFEKFTTTCELMFEVLCRPVPTLLKGHGCDGVDSNCDSDRFPDECAEDKYPPEFRLSRFAEFCGADKHVSFIFLGLCNNILFCSAC